MMYHSSMQWVACSHWPSLFRNQRLDPLQRIRSHLYPEIMPCHSRSITSSPLWKCFEIFGQHQGPMRCTEQSIHSTVISWTPTPNRPFTDTWYYDFLFTQAKRQDSRKKETYSIKFKPTTFYFPPPWPPSFPPICPHSLDSVRIRNPEKRCQIPESQARLVIHPARSICIKAYHADVGCALVRKVQGVGDRFGIVWCTSIVMW